MIAITNARIYDYHKYKENKYILLNDKIVEIGDMKNFPMSDYEEVIDLQNNIVMPGFVSGHTHIYSALARGMNVDFNPQNFKEILKQLWWKVDHFLDMEMIYYSAFSSGLKQLLAGTTTLIDHHASNTISGSLNQIKKALIDDLGIRAILAFETSDRFDIEAAIKENRDFINNNKTKFCAGLFGLHASFTLSDETLNKVKNNLGDAGIHIHVAESQMDEDDSHEKYNKSVVKRLADFDLINDKSILVHCTNVSEEELQIVKDKNAYIALNVTSNMNNAVGLPDVSLMAKKAINIIIGNDGLIQSMPVEYLNTYYSAHLRSKNPIGLSIDIIKKAIINIYDYVNKLLGTNLGRIEPGCEADLISFPYYEYTPINEDNIFGHAFYGMFPNLRPQYVFCNGNKIVDDYKVKESLLNINSKAKESALKLWEIIEKEGGNLEFKN